MAGVDPFKNTSEGGTVHARTCYVCEKVHGCIVLLNMRIPSFNGTCTACDRKGMPDCHVTSTAKPGSMPVICEECGKVTS